MDRSKILGYLCWNKKMNLPSLIMKIILVVVCFYIFIDFFNIWDMGKDKNDSLISSHAAAIVIFTAILIWVAYSQLHKIREVSRSEFILHVNDRLSSSEIVSARVIIQELVCKIGDESNENIAIKFSESMQEMSKDKDRAEAYTRINILLSFMETIACLCNKHPDLFDDVYELPGILIDKYYALFEKHIIDTRYRNKNDRYYCELSQFSENMKNEERKKKKLCWYCGK